MNWTRSSGSWHSWKPRRSAWDQAIDMNAFIREQLNNLRNNGVDDKTLYKLIDRLQRRLN